MSLWLKILKGPAFSVFAMQEMAGGFGVENFAAEGVVFDWAFDERREIGELREFGERAADVEARESFAVSFAGFDPFPLMAFDSRQRFGRTAFEIFEGFFGQQDVSGVPGVLGVKRTFGADEEIAPAAARETEQQIGRWFFFGVPGEFDGRQVSARRKVHHDLGGGGIAFEIAFGGPGLKADDDLLRAGARGFLPELFETEGAKHDVGSVAAEVANDAAAERAPTAPACRNVFGAVGTFVGGSEPKIPIEAFGNRRRFLRPMFRAIAAVEPDVGFANVANDAAPNEFNGAAQASFGGALVAHLRDDFVFGSSFAHDARFVNGARKRFFAVNMLAAFHGRDGGNGMGVIGRGDENGVDLLFHFVEHFAEILIAFGSGMFLVDVTGAFEIDVAEGDEVVAHVGKSVEAAAALAADADARDVEFAVRLVSEGEFAVAQNEEAGTGCGGFGKKRAAIKLGFHAVVTNWDRIGRRRWRQ